MINYKYRRFDPTNTKLEEISFDFANNFGTKANLSLDNEFLELIRLRVSLLKQCNYCVIVHTQRALEFGVSQIKVASVAAYYESELFTHKELTALKYTDSVVSADEYKVKEAHQELVKNFTKQEVEDIISSVINMIFFVHYKLVTGQVAVSEK